MNPLISIIVPVYNTEQYLDKCIESIVKQTYTNLEIILVDDGSPDNCPAKCDEWAEKDTRIKVIHKRNGGLSSARNAGLDVCKGEYVGFVDSDDWLSPTMYENLLDACKDERTISAIGVNQVTEEGKVTVKRRFSKSIINTEQLLGKILCRQDGMAVWFRLFPRSVIGNIRFDETKLNEDVLFMVSIMKNVDYVSYSSEIGYYYLQRTGSISRIFGKAIHDMVGNAIEIRKYVTENFPMLAKEAERFEIYQHMSFMLSCPSTYDRQNDPLYSQVLSYIRRHLIAGAKNSCLSFKDKMKLFGVALCPRIMSKLVEYRSRKKHGASK